MKKRIIAISLGIFSTFTACAVEIKISNIAGFASFKYIAGSSQCTPGTAPFTEPDGESPDINQLFSHANFLGFTGDFIDNTQLLTWNPDRPGHEYFLWCGDGEGTAFGFPELDNKWITGDLVVTNNSIRSGMGFFITTTREALGVIDGIVNTNDTVEIEVVAGKNLLANPYPTAIDIQDIQSFDLLGLDENLDFQVTLRYWTGTHYDEYGWCAEGQGETLGVAEWGSRWVNLDRTAIADQPIEIGEIFWIVTPVPATITITKPGCLFIQPHNHQPYATLPK